MQINVDEDAYRILKETRDKMIAGGIRASFSDAVRALEAGDCHRRPRGNAGDAMTAKDAFSLTPAEWDRVEERYRKVAGLQAEDMLVQLLAGASATQQQYLALGIMIGRASR